MAIRNTNTNTNTNTIQEQQNTIKHYPYISRSGRSNIKSVAYDDLETQIIVVFEDGSSYLYTNTSTSPMNIKKMCQLARLGRGLNSFISRVVKKGFKSKLS